MTLAYVVTESKYDTEIIKKLLQSSDDVFFTDGSSKSGAQSLASTILSVRQKPVAIVVDADTENSDAIQERQEFITDLLAQSTIDSPFKVFIAIPELASLLLPNKALSEQLLNRPISEAEWELARHDPKKFLSNMPGGRRVAINQILDSLTDAQVAELQRSPLIQEITAFLASVTGKNGA